MSEPVATFTYYVDHARVFATVDNWKRVRQQIGQLRVRDITADMRALQADVEPILAETNGQWRDFSFTVTVPAETIDVEPPAIRGLRDLASRFGWVVTTQTGPW